MTWSLEKLDEIQSYIEEKESSFQFIATEGSEGVKTCTACFETLPIGNFTKQKGTKDNHNPRCRACKNGKKKALDFGIDFGNLHLKRFKNKNVVTWYLEDAKGNFVRRNCCECGKLKLIEEFNKDSANSNGIQSRCRQCVSIGMKDYYKENKSEIRKYNQIYHKENRSKINEQQRKYYSENITDPIWAERRREVDREANRIYREQNREKIKARDAKRNTMKRNLPTDPIFENRWVESRERSDNRCVLTGDVLSKSECHLDHIIPVSSGHGGTYAGNCVPLRGDLNMSKNDRNPFEWFEEIKERKKLEQELFDKMISDVAGWHDMTPEEYREYVYWCMENPRTDEQIEADNERYGRNGQPVSSVKLFRMWKAGQYMCA